MEQPTTEIIAIVNHAGGVGKTTTDLDLGFELARLGRRVCLVDLDPQANLSDRLQLTPVAPGLAQVLGTGRGRLQPTHCEWPGIEVWLDVIPSALDMAGTELALAGVINGRERRLAEALAPLADAYDLFLIDCPPSLSLLTANALYAATGVIIPVQAQDKAYQAIPLVLETVANVARYNQQLPTVLGLLVTLTANTSIEREVERLVLDEYPQEAFATRIPRLVEYVEDARWQAPIGVYRPKGRGAEAYRTLAAEVDGRLSAGPRFAAAAILNRISQAREQAAVAEETAHA